jgi:hypothetical protein
MKRNTCKLHNVNFEEGEVDIRYGLIRFGKEYLQAKKKHFPNANSLKVGGCFVYESQPKTTTLSYCPHCREAEKEWLASNNMFSSRDKVSSDD